GKLVTGVQTCALPISASLNTRDFDLAVSADGTIFTTVAQVRGNMAAVTTSPVTATGRYVRLTVRRPTQGSDPAARIYELEVYGRSEERRVGKGGRSRA